MALNLAGFPELEVMEGEPTNGLPILEVEMEVVSSTPNSTQSTTTVEAPFSFDDLVFVEAPVRVRATRQLAVVDYDFRVSLKSRTRTVVDGVAQAGEYVENIKLTAAQAIMEQYMEASGMEYIPARNHESTLVAALVTFVPYDDKKRVVRFGRPKGKKVDGVIVPAEAKSNVTTQWHTLTNDLKTLFGIPDNAVSFNVKMTALGATPRPVTTISEEGQAYRVLPEGTLVFRLTLIPNTIVVEQD
jgi:hypothetical protein